ncbi:benzoate para-hydroxylase [Cyathus striatus]|nr:benzoate para-hydroxylase [Cyathus striatus]
MLFYLTEDYRQLALYAAACIICFIHWNSKRRDPLSKIPGPFITRLSPAWLAYQARMGKRYIAVNELHKKFGKIVRISPRHISISDYTEIDTVFGQGTRALDKSKFYDAFVCGTPSVFSTTDRNEHSKKRKLLSRAFSYESLRKCTALIENSLQQFFQELNKISDTGEVIDVLEWLNHLAFDILSDLAFGEAIGMVNKRSDIVEVQRSDGKIDQEHAISLVDEREHLSVIIGIWPILGKIAKWIPDPLFQKGCKSSVGLADFARRCIMKRLEAQTRRADLLTKLIDAHGEMVDVHTTESIVELTAETVTLLIAGSDTTSSSLAAIMFLTLTHQPVYFRLVENLESEIGDRSLTYDLVKNIPYLDAVIHEGLRHHATTAIGLHRVVPTGGIVCCGYEIPEGTEVSIPAFTIQHDPEIWGDAENFRPERWLGSDDLKPYLLTFGRGPRACLGRNLAFIEMRLILAMMLLHYKIELREQSMPTVEGFMHKPQRLMATLTRRNRPSRDES